jgi:hypothetical protein
MRITALRLLRGLGWSVAGLLGIAILVAAAWVASNWSDIEPVPRPSALALPAPSLADDRNAYFTLVGLRERAPQSLTGDQRSCDNIDDCVARQWANAGRVQEQRQAHQTFGQRCEALVETGFAFEERLPPTLNSTAPIAEHLLRASQCSQWLLSGAVVAAAQGQREDALSRLGQADRLARGLLQGSHTLLAQRIAQRLARGTFGTAAALAVRDRALAQRLAPLLAPLPNQAEAVRRWVIFEAAYQRGLSHELSQACLPDTGANGWLCRHRIGWHPERNAAAIDTHWMTVLGRLDGGLLATIEATRQDVRAAEQAGPWAFLAWRNTMGHTVIEGGKPAYGPPVAGHADLELAHEAASLAVKAAATGVAARERKAWLAQQALRPEAQGRIGWSDDGRTLRARSWLADFLPIAADHPYQAIRVTWP